MGLETGGAAVRCLLSAICCPLTPSLMPTVSYAACTEILRLRLRMTSGRRSVSARNAQSPFCGRGLRIFVIGIWLTKKTNYVTLTL